MKSDKRVAAGKKSRRKGCGFERKVAKQLQEWWGEGVFARTPSSGGWQNKNAREDFNACGDITTSADNFPWVVECKNQEGWSLDQLLLNKGCIIWKWYAQAVEETPYDMSPMLIFKKNRQKAMVMVKANYHMAMDPNLYETSLHKELRSANVRVMFTEDPLGKWGESVMIFPLEELFKIDPRRMDFSG